MEIKSEVRDADRKVVERLPFHPDVAQRPETVQEPGFHFNFTLSSLRKEPKETPCIYPGLHDRVGLSQAVSPGALCPHALGDAQILCLLRCGFVPGG